MESGKVADKAEYTCEGVTQIIASGQFGNNRIAIDIQGDGLRAVSVGTIQSGGVKVLRTAPGTVLKFEIQGTISGSDIDISCLPLK